MNKDKKITAKLKNFTDKLTDKLLFHQLTSN